MTNQKNKRGPPPKGSRSASQRTSPAFVTPMAAQVVKRLPEGDDWAYELKFDGYRALIIRDEQRVELRSRKNKDLTGMYRGVAAAGQRLKAEQAVVAGTPFRALHEHDHTLIAYCATCERWAVLDLER